QKRSTIRTHRVPLPGGATMNPCRIFGGGVLVLMPAAVLCNQPAPVAAPKPVAVSPAADISSEREIARREFLEARHRFAGALVAMMTSEELSQRAAAISARLQVRQTNARLVEVRNRLAVIEGSPDSSVEEV